MPQKKSYLTVTDQFCGAGGSTIGAKLMGCVVSDALNHWRRACETYSANHPDTNVDCTDIQACEPRRYRSTDILITSPECTNHTLAKGKQRKEQAQLDLFGYNKVDPAEERSRATMWDVVRFADVHEYNLIIVENVVDVVYWRLFDEWLAAIHKLGYDHQAVFFNSMFAHLHPDPSLSLAAGQFVPQSRDRVYIVFWKRKNKRPNLDFRPLAPCQRCGNVEAVQSWKNGRRWGKYGSRQQYVYCCPICAQEVTPYFYPASHAIDWTLTAGRIGDRKKPLKDKTIARIEAGLKRFGNRAAVVSLAYTHGHDNRSSAVDELPMPTQTSRQDVGIYFPPFIANLQAGSQATGYDEPLNTVLTNVHKGLVMPPLLVGNYTPGWTHLVTDAPTGTVTTSDHHALVIPPFLMSYYSRDDAVGDIERPMGTITTEPRHALVQPPFILDLRAEYTPREIDGVLSTVCASAKHHALITLPFLASYYGSNNLSGIDEAVPTVTTVDRHALVMPEIKVEDCGFRMLRSHEIGAAMAFPQTYQVFGTEREKVKQYGNAVTPPVMEMLLKRCIETFQ